MWDLEVEKAQLLNLRSRVMAEPSLESFHHSEWKGAAVSWVCHLGAELQGVKGFQNKPFLAVNQDPRQVWG